MEKKDVGRIKAITTKTLSDFIRLEEGSTGKQNALKTGAALGGSVLAQVLFSALDSADANPHASSGGGHVSNTHGSGSFLYLIHGSAL